MLINKSTIASLNPCKDRFDNFLKFYENKEFTLRQFMGLKNITHDDKMWVAFRSMPREAVVAAAADIAESVLHIYEAAYPKDDRPRKAIEAARSGDKDAAADAANAADAAAAAYANAAAAYAANAAANADRKAQEKLCRTIVLRHWKTSSKCAA